MKRSPTARSLFIERMKREGKYEEWRRRYKEAKKDVTPILPSHRPAVQMKNTAPSLTMPSVAEDLGGGGEEEVSQKHRVVVLKRKWQSDPWSEFEERAHPKNWDGRLPLLVVPDYPEKHQAVLGKWLVDHMQDGRNTIRFLLPQKGTGDVYYDRELIVLARAVYLSMKWKTEERVYGPLERSFRKDELVPKIKSRFDRFAVLSVWNFAEPAQCEFEESKHDSLGSKIPDAVDRVVREEIFIPEEFEEYVLKLAENSESVGKLMKDLREPRPGGKVCIP